MQIPSKTENQNPTIIEQVRARRTELQKAMVGTKEASTRADIEAALATLKPMLTGDLEHIPDTVSHALVRWLDANKYVGVTPKEPSVEPKTEPKTEPKAESKADLAPIEPIPPHN